MTTRLTACARTLRPSNCAPDSNATGAYPENERFNAVRREPIDVPIVLAGGEHSLVETVLIDHLGRATRLTI